MLPCLPAASRGSSTLLVHILIDYRPALRQRSGAGEFIHRLALALIDADAGGRPGAAHRVSLFSSSWKDRLDRSPFPTTSAHDLRIPVSLLNLAWHRLAWPPIERLVREPIDVVHSPHPLLTPTRRAAQIITIHDLDFLEHPERTRGEIRRDYPRLVRAHAQRADGIIAPSRFTAGLIESRLGVPAERIVLCVPGAPPWSPRADVPHEGYILFIGTLEPRKNLQGLLDAYERLASRGGRVPPLVVAGAETPDSVDDLKRIGSPPLAAHVRYVGYVADADRRALFEGAVALAMPSLNEGFGLPALEAMTLGVPVVAADRGSLPEILGDAGLLADPDDTDAFADRLRDVVFDRERAASLAARGLDRAATFTWRACAESALRAYGAAIDRRRANQAGSQSARQAGHRAD